MALTKYTNHIIRIISITLLAISFIACNDDSGNKKEIPEPTDPVKASVNPAKIELIIHWGHLHGSSFHANPQPKGSPLKRFQKVTFEKKSNKWIPTSSKNNGSASAKKPLVFIGGSKPQDIKKNLGGRYSIEIIMYDNEGNRINKEVADKPNRFQVFFSADNLLDMGTKKKVDANMEQLIIGYRYRDTNPENVMYKPGKNVKLTKTPIGLKSYFAVVKASISYKLHINLMEWTKEDKAESLTFDQDIKKLKNVATAFSITLPVDVPSSHPANEAEEKLHYQILGKYFGITAQEMDDLEWGDIDPESSKYWM